MTALLLAQGGGQWIRVVLTIYSCVCFTLLWVGFAVALVVDRGWLDQLWSWLRGLPAALEIIAWIAFLPIAVSLWIWQAPWPTSLRTLGFLGIVAWTLLAISSLVRLVRST